MPRSRGMQGGSGLKRNGETARMAESPLPVQATPTRNTRALKVTLIAGAALALLALDLVSIGMRDGAQAFGLAVVLALIPLPYFLSLGLWADRYEPESQRLLLMTFLWGAGVAGFLAGFLNGAGIDIVSDNFGEERGWFFGLTISAPFVEETLKGAVLFLLWWRTSAINGVLDGIVYALMSGLGFAFIENIAYYSREADEGGFPAAFQEFVGRGLLNGLMHPVFTAMTGVGIGLAVLSRRRLVKWLAPIAGLAGAMFLHWLNNSMAGDYVGSQYILVTFLAFLTLIGVALLTMWREGRIVRKHIPPDVLPRDEAKRLFSIRGRVAGTVGAFVRGGWRGLKARDDYIRTITEIAWARHRAGPPSPPAEQPPSEVEAMYRERLRRVEEAAR
jgi:RsiW-degrading membrane proteinase PrsW (M82 family)